ncbi:DUF6194 family protein [Rhodococcus sp. HM1]|uniref:DUF6194 family protein n=1 Tax=Rhodococcus sp. HM1 TaxID=2937759 RepID=UPI00200A5260|nr:DUF6194 family protein [Rhodococcus sp. HM1]MCK8672696.1 DUF6194 family protein [Rhodococcus sp. HM1]
MSIDEIIDFVTEPGGVLALRPVPGDGSPEISWGDTFFYYAPDGRIPEGTQPFATIVTKDYPGDEKSQLNRPDAFRLNVFAGKDAFIARTGVRPREAGTLETDPSVVDRIFAHPVYGTLGWLSVVNPGRGTDADVRELLAQAHALARSRYRPGR